MNAQIKALKRALLNRQAELQQLIRQMKSDQLNESAVFKTLKNELGSIEQQLHQDNTRKK